MDDWSPESGSLSVATLNELYASKPLRPSDVIRAVYRRMERWDHVWISKVSLAQALDQASALEKRGPGFPLYGVPFGIKDNIDLAGVPTTGACREFAFTPTRSATVVAR